MKQLLLTFLLLIATAQPARGFEFLQQQCAENPAAATAFFGLSAMSLLYLLRSCCQDLKITPPRAPLLQPRRSPEEQQEPAKLYYVPKYGSLVDHINNKTEAFNKGLRQPISGEPPRTIEQAELYEYNAIRQYNLAMKHDKKRRLAKFSLDNPRPLTKLTDERRLDALHID